MLNSISRVSQKEACANLQKAFTEGNEKAIEKAFDGFYNSVAEVVKQDYLETNNDRAALAQRGYRTLTNAETKFYDAIIRAGKEGKTVQAANDLLDQIVTNDDTYMPQTIIEDVYKNLTEEHPLLNKITFQNVSYLTKWIINDHTVQMAAYGKINTAITKEIDSALKVLEMTQGKLTAFCLIDKDMLDLGPTFIDNYMRTCLTEAIATALEYGIIKGKGIDGEPIGLVKDVHEGVSVSTSTGYPDKTAVEVTDFTPATYGSLVASLVKTEKGRLRTINGVSLLVNPIDYYKKVMPATTILNTNGTYVNNVFPVPTDVIQTSQLDEGTAVMFLPEEYFAGLGASKQGNIEFSDQFRFIEDLRCIKIKTYVAGRAFDNTVAIVLDISKLEAAFLTVNFKQESTAENATA